MKSADAWNYMDNLCYKYDCHDGDGCEAVHSRSRHRNKKKYKLPELNDAEVNGRKFHLSHYVGILIPEGKECLIQLEFDLKKGFYFEPFCAKAKDIFYIKKKEIALVNSVPTP